MVDELEKYLFDYMNNRVSALKQYLLTALDKEGKANFSRNHSKKRKSKVLT